MHLLRLLIITATLVSLPGYGLAAAGQLRGCPAGAPADAAHAAHAPMDGMHMDGMAMPDDCCPGAGDRQAPDPHAPDNGGCTACQAGHACKNSQGVQLVPTPILAPILIHPTVAAGPVRHASLCGPDGLLRPPNAA